MKRKATSKSRGKASVLLIIPMAVVELMLLGAAWCMAVLNPRIAKSMVLWSLRVMPDKEWYT